MKDTFYTPIQLLALEEQLKAHKPYAALAISTTGLNTAEFKEHSPIRVVMQQYAYNNDTMEYEPTDFRFDKEVACSRLALEKAIENADKAENPYDTFLYAGINREDYIKGEGVSSVSDFKRDFELYLDGIKKDTLLIINGGYAFAKDSLTTIDCMDKIEEMRTDRKICDLLPLSKQYFQKRNATFKGKAPRLEELNALILDKDVSSAERIVGTDNRVETVSNFVIRYAKDEKFIEGESWEKFYKKREAEMLEMMSKNGRRDYESKSFTEKFASLTEMKRGKGTVIEPEKVKDIDSDCDLSVFLRTVRGQENKKGFIIMQAASTGMDYKATTLAGRLGEPIQFSAIVYDFVDGKLEKKDGVSFNIKASNEAIAKAQAVAETGKFDAFKYAGINSDEYLAGKKVHPINKAVEKLNEFFGKYDLNEYALVSNGRQNSGRLFTQDCISQIASLGAVTAPCIDFTQVIKEYCYLVHEENALYPTNAIVNAETFNEKDFGLESIAKHNTNKELTSTKDRCAFTYWCLQRIYEQQKELFADKFVQKSDAEAVQKVPELEKQEVPEEDIPVPVKDEEPKQEEISAPDIEDEPAPELVRNEENSYNTERSNESYDEDEPPVNRRFPRPSEREEQRENRYNRYRHRPAGMPQRDSDEERPYRAPVPDMSGEVRALINAVRQTNELNQTLAQQIATQNRVMESITDKLFGIITEQSDVIRTVAEIAEKSEQAEPKKLTEKLDHLKDQIDEVRKEVKDSKIRESLTDANNALAKGQRLIEDPEKKKEE